MICVVRDLKKGAVEPAENGAADGGILGQMGVGPDHAQT